MPPGQSLPTLGGDGIPKCENEHRPETYSSLSVTRITGYKITPKKAAEMRNEHWRMSKDKVGHRLDLQATRPDFVSYILRHNDERGMTRQEIEENAGVLILAGSETTATLLSGCPFYVLKHPEKYNKLVQEIRGAFQKQDDITFLSVARLPYSHAVLEESLRLYPPVPEYLPRKVPMGGRFH